jgi:hypothetical protein
VWATAVFTMEMVCARGGAEVKLRMSMEIVICWLRPRSGNCDSDVPEGRRISRGDCARRRYGGVVLGGGTW